MEKDFKFQEKRIGKRKKIISEKKISKDEETRVAIIDYYLNQNLSYQEIGKLVNKARQHVRNVIIHYEKKGSI